MTLSEQVRSYDDTQSVTDVLIDEFFKPKDPRVYKIVEIVNCVLNNVDDLKLPIEQLTKIEAKDPEFIGLANLLALALEKKSDGVKSISISFGPKATVQSAIEDCTKVLDGSYLKDAKPLDFDIKQHDFNEVFGV